MKKIAIDVMGGDFGSGPILAGVVQALKKQKFEAILVGDEYQIKTKIPKRFHQYISVVHTTDVIDMSSNATDALKRKQSSIYKAVELVKSGEASAVVSAGHSGATMSLATLRLGRLQGVSRPAIATFMPSLNGNYTLVLDVGANVDSKSDNLFQFALMGEAYAKDILGVQSPKVGLLSNGEEKSKGNEVTKEAHELLKELPTFIGNVEGGDIFHSDVDVVVCDGFVGNILLKTSEGVASSIRKILKDQIKKSPISMVGATLLRRVFSNLKKRIDYAEYGGAPLLGVKGCTIVSHGKSNAKAIKNAIFQAIEYTDSDINEDIIASLKK
jgi:glycerol-3-phosphate acyltransferase PlsX